MFNFLISYLGPRFTRRFSLGGHGSLQLGWKTDVFAKKQREILIDTSINKIWKSMRNQGGNQWWTPLVKRNLQFTYTSTRSTFTPQGSVASSKIICYEKWYLLAKYSFYCFLTVCVASSFPSRLIPENSISHVSCLIRGNSLPASCYWSTLGLRRFPTDSCFRSCSVVSSAPKVG